MTTPAKINPSPNRGEVFDERAMPSLDSEAIDFRAASESVAAVRRLGELAPAHRGAHHRLGSEVPDNPVVGVSQVFATQRTEERIGGRLLSSEVSIAGPL